MTGSVLAVTEGRWRFSVSTNLYKILRPKDLLVCAVKF